MVTLFTEMEIKGEKLEGVNQVFWLEKKMLAFIWFRMFGFGLEY